MSKIERIRKQIKRGTYLSPAKIKKAVEELYREICKKESKGIDNLTRCGILHSDK